MPNPIKALNAECLYHIATYFDGLAYLVRLFVACRGFSLFPKSDDEFWGNLLTYYLLEQDNLDSYQRIEKRMRTRKKNFQLIYELFSTRKCTRSGCFKLYKEVGNDCMSCYYHPGRKTAGRLTCCREKSFQTPGCKTGHHDGMFFQMVRLRRPLNEDSTGTAKEDEATTTLFPLVSQPPASSVHAPVPHGIHGRKEVLGVLGDRSSAVHGRKEVLIGDRSAASSVVKLPQLCQRTHSY